MSKVLCEKSDLVAIADSIRSKTGSTDGMKVAEIPQKIEAIETGSNINIQASKSVTYTSNGTATITPDEGYDGLSKVTVTANIQFVRTIELSETSETEVESLGAWVVLASMGSIGVTPKELCRENFEEIVIDVTLPNGKSMIMVYCVDVDTTILPILAGQTPSTVTFRSAAGEVNIPMNGTMVTVSPEILNEIKSQITTWVHGILGSTPTITFSNPAHIGTKLF